MRFFTGWKFRPYLRHKIEVDKVIIAQDGLKRLINDLSPGVYVALTRIDFKILDSLTVRPIGVYGDRLEIIKFLSSLKVLDEYT